MSFGGANISRMNGGLGRATTSDRVVVLIVGMTLPTEGMEYNKAFELLDLTTAEDLGITASLDDVNSELTHYHLEEIFDKAPESKCWILPIENTTTIAALVASDAIKAAIRSVDNVNVLGICGLNTTVENAIADSTALQGLVNEFETEHILIDGVLVEGVGAAATMAIADYPDRRSITAPAILHVIAQDPAVASLKPAYAKRAALGTSLGAVLVRKVHEDLGSVDIEQKPRSKRGNENYSLTNETLGYWLDTALSDGTKFSSLSIAEQKALTAKGWMYVGKFAGYGGYYFNGCPTSVAASSDYSYFNFNCIWNKAARIIRNVLIPKVRSKVPTEKDGSGYIKSTWISSSEATVGKALDAMVSANNIDDYDIYINPAQAPSETTALKVKGVLQIGYVVHEFDVDLGLTHKL